MTPQGQPDPRRPVYLAARMMQILGLVIVLSTAILAAIVAFPLIHGGIVNRRLLGAQILMLVIAYAGPGLVYLLCGNYLRNRRSWAILPGLVCASVHLMLTVLGGIWLIGMAMASGTVWLWLIVPIFALVGALTILIINLARSIRTIQYEGPVRQQGFEVNAGQLPEAVVPQRVETTSDSPSEFDRDIG